MAAVYILYSKDADKHYIGSCLDLSERLNQHKNLSFKDAYTRISSDWELILSIDMLSYSAARKIEAHIKKMKSRKYIHNLIQYAEMREKLIELYS